MPKKPKGSKLYFVTVRAFANKNGYSMNRNPTGGFRVWKTGNTAEQFSNPVQPTLKAAQAFVQSEIDKAEVASEWDSAS